MNPNKQLDVLTFPLNGVSLIEASAGTGKTYTIAALYLRLILGHKTSVLGLKRDLLPPDILVMTFTDASTQELRDRIRARLTDAARYFRQSDPRETDDELLKALREQTGQTAWECAGRLEAAANWMDEASVYTIHGWCNRMLKQHAFDSGSLFHQELRNDDADLLHEVIEDYWREHFYAQSVPVCRGVFDWVHSPADLSRQIRSLLKETEALPLTDMDDLEAQFERLDQEHRQWAQLENRLRECLIDDWACFERTIREASDKKWLSGSRYKVTSLSTDLKQIRDWVAFRHDLDKPELFGKYGRTRLCDGLVKAHTDKRGQFDSEVFGLLDVLHQLMDKGRQQSLNQRLMLHAVRWIRDRYARQKRQFAQMTFDDMLVYLDRALSGERGEQLAALIREQYPVAMIDEFQDTDPVQYRIFSKIYPAGQSHPIGCYLIGDPKQAIYSFRGADIFTYLKAHDLAGEQHYTLHCNYRSVVELVIAVNHLFLQADRQLPKGAFQFKTETANPLAFVDVTAQGRKDSWQTQGQPVPPLTFWCLESDQPLKLEDYQQRMAARTAAEIVTLLMEGTAKNTGFRQVNGELQAMAPGDIAILVRTSREASIMQQALSRCQLPSVYLSERDSVYATVEAGDMLLWLKAFAEPRNETRIRTALGSSTLGFSHQQLFHWVKEEADWEVHLERFPLYHQRWQEDGILPAIRQFMADYDLHAQLLDQQGQERCLTNLLHLAELLQRASGEVDGEQALIRYLVEAMEAAEQSGGDESILRLESDANLIQIITLHKSKGLEYPLVFLPFICGFRETKAKDFFRYHDPEAQMALRMNLESDEAKTRLADAERLQEDIRLLYVALTRARHRCWVGMAPVKVGQSAACQLEKSAIGYLIGWETGQLANALSGHLEQMARGCSSIRIETVALLPEPLARFVSGVKSSDAPEVRISTQKVADDWWIASYSALKVSDRDWAAARKGISAEYETPGDQRSDEDWDEDERVKNDPVSSEVQTVLQLPKGSGPGILVHELLEKCGREGFSRALQDTERRTAWIDRIFPLPLWQPDRRVIIDQALTRWLTLPLLGVGNDCCLAALTTGHYQVEYEFTLGVSEQSGVEVTLIDRVVQAATFQGKPRPALKTQTLKGLMKGFMDLVFEYQGRYYVADYKFNSLGSTLADYAPDRLQEAMLAKRYDLQMVVYLLALHRLLKIRLGRQYDYDTHMGGGLYLFLRGVDQEDGGKVLERPDRGLIETLDTCFGGAS